MGKFRVKILNEAKKDLAIHYKSVLKKIDKIIIELSEHPFLGVGNPEPLKYNLNGYWSRRLNSKDRIIYKVDDDAVIVYVVSALGHYSDK
jgi:toxin YoeB